MSPPVLVSPPDFAQVRFFPCSSCTELAQSSPDSRSVLVQFSTTSRVFSCVFAQFSHVLAQLSPNSRPVFLHPVLTQFSHSPRPGVLAQCVLNHSSRSSHPVLAQYSRGLVRLHPLQLSRSLVSLHSPNSLLVLTQSLLSAHSVLPLFFALSSLSYCSFATSLLIPPFFSCLYCPRSVFAQTPLRSRSVLCAALAQSSMTPSLILAETLPVITSLVTPSHCADLTQLSYSFHSVLTQFSLSSRFSPLDPPVLAE